MPEKQKIIEVHIPSILGYEKVAMESAAAAAKIMGFHQSRIEDLKTAISEACSNAMEHGNRFKKDTGGWGMFLIKNLVDEVEMKKIPKGGNITRMVIHVNR